MIHPEQSEWMDFLYEEVAPARKRDLLQHLEQCPSCARHLDEWRESMQALDKFELPPAPRIKRSWAPVFQFAAAAAFVLLAGFALGRRGATSPAEIESLRHSVAQLALMVQAQETTGYSNSIFAATTAASEETIRLLGDYSRGQEDKRLADRQALGLALQTFEARLARVTGDLETVAVNTQTGFQETHQNLSQLVSYYGPVPGNQK